MIGQTWPSEISTFTDEKTGRTIKRLTTTGNNVHMYFTENSFRKGMNEIIFQSDRAYTDDKAPHENPAYNVFKMALDTGEITQLTDDAIGPHGATKTPDGRIVVYTTENKIKALNTETGEITLVYEETGDFSLGSPNIAPGARYIAFARNENVRIPSHYTGVNYHGFKDRYYLIKDGRITMAYLDGSGWADVFKDTHQVGHFQFCPDDPTIGMFCHEGPWNLVTQRIWLVDFVSHEVMPIFRQEEQDSIGHEFWTQDGYIFFDNRGPGHDGTITSDRTQAVLTDVAVNENSMIPFVGLVDRKGQLVKRIDMPYYCNHYHANPDNSVLVGDDIDDLVLISIDGQETTPQVICTHGTSWRTQSSHCHPTWDWDGSRILYASDKGGKVNLYLLENM
ncbi:MAG: oligogalacturonate lyase [Anaerolineae bacterium]